MKTQRESSFWVVRVTQQRGAGKLLCQPLEKCNVECYNPQVDDWYPDLVEIEASAKQNASCFLWVIDGKTRALASMVEVTELILKHRSRVFLVVNHVTAGEVIDGQVIKGRELEDLNRARTYLVDTAERNGATMCKTVMEATCYIVQSMTRSSAKPPGQANQEINAENLVPVPDVTKYTIAQLETFMKDMDVQQLKQLQKAEENSHTPAEVLRAPSAYSTS